MNAPYFKFYVNDWLTGRIQYFTMEQQGIFVNICAMAWNGNLPSNEDVLAHALRVDKQMLSNCLILLKQEKIICLNDDGSIFVKFIEEQKNTMNDVSVKRSLAGSKGGQANAKQMLSKRQAIACNQIQIQNQSLKKDTIVSQKREVFQIPSIEEISKHCQERNNGINAEQFWNHYQSKGWMIGKNKMKDWKAAIRTWEKNNRENQPYLFSKPRCPYSEKDGYTEDQIQSWMGETEGYRMSHKPDGKPIYQG